MAHLRSARISIRRASGPLVAWLIVLAGAAAVGAQADYAVGRQDVLLITVWQQADFSGRFTVEGDGSFAYPLVGRVRGAGLTVSQIQEELKRQLVKGGYLTDPKVTVALEAYRSQQVFVVGEVRTPGTYPLTGSMSLMEALARAGSTTADASGEVVVVRPRTGRAAMPMLPPQQDSQSADLIRVNLRDLQSGVVGSNIALRDGDTVYVSRGEKVYVYGQVRSPGAYSVQGQTTVIQALSLAGGVTERGASNRVRVARLVNGEKKELKVKLSDLVQPGDTIVVPERFF
jgi:polysaccharide export outer membrane protein